VVFDEVHFGNFSAAYTSTHKYFFDVHPPLGKLLVSSMEYVGGYPGTTTNYSTIGNTFGDPRYMWDRILPMLAGTALPIIIFLLCLELGVAPLLAFFAGLMVIFENSLLVHSRFILLDIFLIFFGFLALLFYAYSLREGSGKKMWYLTLVAAFLVTLSYSVKWTGLSFLGMIFLIELVAVARSIVWKPRAYLALKKICTFLVVGFVVYFSLIMIHFALLPISGSGDAFMTASFQKTLEGSTYENDSAVKPLNNFERFIELNKQMYISSATLSAEHQYGSRWYEWPLMERSIFYWENNVPGEAGEKAMIYLLGNPFIYWLSTLAMALILVQVLFVFLSRLWKLFRGTYVKSAKSFLERYKTELLLLAFYFANLLPYSLIGRVQFLYHYETALLTAIVATAYLIYKHIHGKTRMATVCLLIVVCAVGFVYFSPLSYGIAMNETELLNRFWFTSWR